MGPSISSPPSSAEMARESLFWDHDDVLNWCAMTRKPASCHTSGGSQRTEWHSPRIDSGLSMLLSPRARFGEVEQTEMNDFKSHTHRWRFWCLAGRLMVSRSHSWVSRLTSPTIPS